MTLHSNPRKGNLDLSKTLTELVNLCHNYFNTVKGRVSVFSYHRRRRTQNLLTQNLGVVVRQSFGFVRYLCRYTSSKFHENNKKKKFWVLLRYFLYNYRNKMSTPFEPCFVKSLIKWVPMITLHHLKWELGTLDWDSERTKWQYDTTSYSTMVHSIFQHFLS